MVKALLSSVPSGLEVSNEHAYMSAQAEIITFQENMACDRVNEPKAGQAICDTTSFQDSSFMKTLRTLQSLELPASFVKQNGHNFQAKVVLQGPRGFTAVHLAIQSSPIQDRVHIRGPEWRDFLLENGFQVGHQLIFSLVSKSVFTVRAAHVDIQESVHRVEEAKVCHVTDKPWESHLKSDVVYARGTWDCKRAADMLVGKLRCPHFVTRITKSHLRHWRSSKLSVPREFYDKYAAYFSEGANVFQGPNGRIMKLRFSKNTLSFTSGWLGFQRESDIKLGDVLLFSLCEPARWLIQFVERKVEETPTRSECDCSDLE